MDQAVIGGGISGLGLAWELGRQGQRGVLLEAGPGPGGLAGPLALAGHPVERYYHYLCPADTALLDLARALGVGVRFVHASQALWDGDWHGLNGPADLLRLPLPWSARAALAWGSLGLGGAEPGLDLDAVEARAWARRRFGAAAAERLFLPLIDGKFGQAPLSAAWLRHRLWRSRQGARWDGPRAGYFDGGYQRFFDALAQGLSRRGWDLRCRRPVLGLRRRQGLWELRLGGGKALHARRVFAALPAPALLRALGPLRSPWAAALKRLRWRALVQPVFALRRPVSPYFWNNLPLALAPFNGLVQGEALRPLPYSLAYLPAYVDAASPWLRRGERGVLDAAWSLLRRLQPALRDEDRLDAFLGREALAQPILAPGSGATLPSMHADLPGLHWLDACHLHPGDRSLDACLRAGRRLLRELPTHA